jgi:glycosyltransferase involved in cell wall biosynthesis
MWPTAIRRSSSDPGIDRLLGDPALRARLGARAREDYLQRFSAERLTAAIAALYGELGFTP